MPAPINRADVLLTTTKHTGSGVWVSRECFQLFRTIAKYCLNQDLQDVRMLRIGKYSQNLKVLSQIIIVTNDFAVVLGQPASR